MHEVLKTAQRGADRRPLQQREIEDQEGAHEAQDEPARERDEIRDFRWRGPSRAGPAVETGPRKAQGEAPTASVARKA